MLSNPLRALSRRFVAREPINDQDLDNLEKTLKQRGISSIADAPKSLECVASAAIGAAEGLAARFGQVVVPCIETVRREGPIRAGLVTTRALQSALPVAQRKATTYLALTGVLRPSGAEAREAMVGRIVKDAAFTTACIEREMKVKTFPSLEDFETIARGLLGINSGADEVVEIRIHRRQERSLAGSQTKLDLHAFDRAGYHVLWAELASCPELPGALFIEQLIATHGRNAEDLELDFGGAGVPGRGNNALVARALEAVLVHGSGHGLWVLGTIAASPMVQRLYMKMGFAPPGTPGPFRKQWFGWALEQMPLGPELSDAMILGAGLLRRQTHRGDDFVPEIMSLDMTRPEAVRQALVAFALSRAGMHDVPKNVAARLAARGETPSPPSAKAWRKDLLVGQNVRVVRLARVQDSSASKVETKAQIGRRRARRTRAPSSTFRVRPELRRLPSDAASASSGWETASEPDESSPRESAGVVGSANPGV